MAASDHSEALTPGPHSHPTARIVPLSLGLIPAVVACAQATWHAAYDDLLPAGQVEYMLAERTEHDALAAYVAAADRWFDVALADGSETADVLGYTSCRIKTPSTLRLEQIYVQPGQWGHGMADALLERVLARARDTGASMVDLTVNRGNARALAFYRKRHFALVDEIVTDIGGGFVMDDYVLALKI